LPLSNIVFITAFRPDGSPFSIVTSLEGKLYVGDVKLRFPCPCGWKFQAVVSEIATVSPAGSRYACLARLGGVRVGSFAGEPYSREKVEGAVR
jgi:hypothetical protein